MRREEGRPAPSATTLSRRSLAPPEVTAGAATGTTRRSVEGAFLALLRRRHPEFDWSIANSGSRKAA